MSLIDERVRTWVGIPPLEAFATKDITPLIIDISGAIGYFVNAANVVTPLGGGGGGGVSTVTATLPLASSGGANPVISMPGLIGWGGIGQAARIDATGTAWEWFTPGTGTGTVTTFSFTDDAVFDGTVTNPGTTPNLSLSLLSLPAFLMEPWQHSLMGGV